MVVAGVGATVRRTVAVLLIVASIVVGVMCEVSLQGIRESASTMSSEGRSIASIESVGGKTLEEAYYAGFGAYLSRQSDVYLQIATILARGVELWAMFFVLMGVALLTSRDPDSAGAMSGDALDAALPPL